MGNILNNFDSLRKLFEEILEENKTLKEELEKYRIEEIPLGELLTKESIILHGNQELIDKVTHQLLKQLGMEFVPLNTKAQVIFGIDNSGSMGIYEKYMSRCFCLWISQILKVAYQDVDFKFIIHSTEAEEVSEEDFFSKGDGGGTIASSFYKKANLLIEESNYEKLDTYVFHMSDGDNLTSDCPRCVKYIDRILNKVNLLGYFEINQYHRSSTLMSYLRIKNHDKFLTRSISEKEEMLDIIGDYLIKI